MRDDKGWHTAALLADKPIHSPGRTTPRRIAENTKIQVGPGDAEATDYVTSLKEYGLRTPEHSPPRSAVSSSTHFGGGSDTAAAAAAAATVAAAAAAVAAEVGDPQPASGAAAVPPGEEGSSGSAANPEQKQQHTGEGAGEVGPAAAAAAAAAEGSLVREFGGVSVGPGSSAAGKDGVGGDKEVEAAARARAMSRRRKEAEASSLAAVGACLVTSSVRKDGKVGAVSRCFAVSEVRFVVRVFWGSCCCCCYCCFGGAVVVVAAAAARGGGVLRSYQFSIFSLMIATAILWSVIGGCRGGGDEAKAGRLNSGGPTTALWRERQSGDVNEQSGGREQTHREKQVYDRDTKPGIPRRSSPSFVRARTANVAEQVDKCRRW